MSIQRNKKILGLLGTGHGIVVFSHELLPYNVGLASGITMGLGIGMGGVGTTVLGWVAGIWGLPAVFQAMTFLPLVAFFLTLFLPRR